MEGADGESLVNISYSIYLPMLLRAIVKLNVPKIIESSQVALSAKQICDQIVDAKQRRASPENLEKLLQVLVCYGGISEIVEAGDGGNITKYALTPKYKDLTNDAITDWLLIQTSFLSAFINLPELVLGADDEESVFERSYKKQLYQYIGEEPELQKLYVTALNRNSKLQMEVLLDLYDEEFQSLQGTLVDVGGNDGIVASIIAARYAKLRCINFELADVVSKAPALTGVDHVAGSFFDFVPPGDIMLLKFILLNWNDEQCVQILTNCYKALAERGKIIIVDKTHIAAGCASSQELLRFRLTEVQNAMLLKGAKTRTLEELQKIALRAGFSHVKLLRIVDTISFVEIVRDQTLE